MDTNTLSVTRSATVHPFPVRKRTPVFVEARHFHLSRYLPPPLHAYLTGPPDGNIALPFNLDAEFLDSPDPYSDDPYYGRQGVTIQIRGTGEPTGLILAHPDQAELARETGRTLRHPVASAPSPVVDWLVLRGHDAEIERRDWDDIPKDLPTCVLVAYAHFAVADVAFLANDLEFAEDIRALYVRKKLAMGRRLVAKTGFWQAARLPWILHVGGSPYCVALKVVDSAGVHGNASYASLAKNVGFQLNMKDAFTREGPDAEIKRMHEMYFARPDDFDAYALGDLHVSDILAANNALWHGLYQDLGVAEHFRQAALTVGSAVASVLAAKLKAGLGADPEMSKEDREAYVQKTTGLATSASLAQKARDKTPGGLLAKVDGGRCRNNQPTVVCLDGALVDVDASGAYASQQANTPFCVGVPVILEYGNGRDRGDLRKAPTLAKFLQYHGTRLVPRAWYARVSTAAPLAFDFELLPSWIGWKLAVQRDLTAEELRLDIRQDVDSGEMRYFARELFNATLTSDLLDAARAAMSPRQWDDFTSKVRVRACAFYDQQAEVSVDVFREMLADGLVGRDTRYRRGAVEYRTNHAWCRFITGDLASDHSRGLRKQHLKGTPQNELFKLVSNTSYGDLVSRYFEIATTVAGSNITAGVRAFMYLSEKALNLAGTITDGHVFDLNAVVHPKVRQRSEFLNRECLPRMYAYTRRQLKDGNIARIAPLAGKRIEIATEKGDPVVTIHHQDGSVERHGGRAARNWVDSTALAHVRRLFPDVPIVNESARTVIGAENGRPIYGEQNGVHAFEMKDFVRHATLHGSANYRFEFLDGTVKTKMRAYESRKEHYAFDLDDAGELVARDDYAAAAPAEKILRAIRDNPHAVPRLPPFLKQALLKPSEFATRKKWHTSNLEPGDTFHRIGRPSLFSLTQFTFQTRDQYEHWKRYHERLKRRSGESFEKYFSNADGTVDFARMIREVDAAIRSGVMVDRNTFDPAHRFRTENAIAIRFKAAQDSMSERLKARTGALDDGLLVDVSVQWAEGQG